MSSRVSAAVSVVETPTSASSIDPAAEGIRRRAPLAEDIRIPERSGLAIGGAVLAVPPFLRMLESTLLRSEVGGPVCIVLPTVEDIAPVIAVLASLELHALDLPAARARFRADGLSKGQRVRLLPSGEVFEIAERTTIHGMPGLWLHHIQIKTRETLPRVFLKLSDVDRFEPTTRLAPAATGKTKHGSVPPPNDIDEIVGERSYGNTALNTTRVFVTGSLAGFERTLQSMPLCPLIQAQRPALTLERIFSFGRLDDDGHPYVSTPAGSIGQPMVCIGYELMDFREAALSGGVAPGSRLFLTDRIELVMRDLDLAARIGERQRMVLLAPAADREDALALRGHGWTVWEPSPEDLAHVARPQVPVGIRGVDVIERAARTETTRHPGFLHCANRSLELSEPSLIVIGDILGGESAEHDERLQDARGAAQSAFFQAAGLLDFGLESEIADLRQNLALLRQRQGYVAKYAGTQAGDAVDAFVLSLERFLAAVEPKGLTPKGERVLRAASDANGSTSNVFVAGNRSGAIHLRAFMARHSIDARCVNVSELREQLGISSVMAMNVMRRDLFARLVDPWPASALTFIGYDFEIECFKRRLSRRADLKHRGGLAVSARSALTGMSVEEFPPPRPPMTSLTPQDVEEARKLDGFDKALKPWNWAPKISVPTARDGEETLSARIIRFNGRSWAAITDEYRVFVLRTESGTSSKVLETTAVDIKVGTRLIFRDGSSKDVIRSLAESHVGEAKYAKLRAKASIWREAIGFSDHPNTVSRKLAQIGLHRNGLLPVSWTPRLGVS